VAIKLQLHTRKLRCRNERCLQKVFCECLTEAAAAHSRQTVRLNETLRVLAFVHSNILVGLEQHRPFDL